uniref:MOSC domain-containing protein n=1 Tax=Alexandrium monilatum TaxID=311494 RepID=A0A7S4VVG0_9DINO
MSPLRSVLQWIGRVDLRPRLLSLGVTVAAAVTAALALRRPLKSLLAPRRPWVGRLFLFPVKGAAPVEVSELHLDGLGFRHDRRWAVLGSKNEVLTMRPCPRLVLVRPQVSGGPWTGLTLSAPGMPPLEVQAPGSDAEKLAYDLWEVPGTARDCGPEAARWLTEFLGREARLAYVPAEARDVHLREPCKQAKWNGGDEAKSVYFPGSTIAFADATPGTIVSRTSLDDLNRRLTHRVAIERFRMNIILEGSAAYEEESWRSFGIGEKTFVMSRRCERCTVPLVNPETGERGSSNGEPIRELRKYRLFSMLPNGDPRHAISPIFGMKFGTSCHTGVIRVGDEVTPLTFWKRGDRTY